MAQLKAENQALRQANDIKLFEAQTKRMEAEIRAQEVQAKAQAAGASYEKTLADAKAQAQASAQATRDKLAADRDRLKDDHVKLSALVEERRRTLVIQRTGWGKSAVYFVATRLLRERARGRGWLRTAGRRR